MSDRVDPLWSALAFLLGAAALAAMSAVTGAGLIHVSTTLNKPAPVVLLVLVLLPAVVLGTFSSPRIAVAAVMAAFVAGPGPTKAAVFFFAALVVLSRIAVGKTPIRWSPPLWWAIALFSWTLFSLGSAVDATLATKAVVVLFLGILFGTVVLAACRSMLDIRWVLGAFVVVAVILVGRALTHVGQLQAIAGTTQVNNRLTGEFGSPNQLGSFCDLGAFVAVGLAFGARSRLGRVAATLSFGVLLAGLTFSLSRGAWIGAILALVYVLLALREARVLAIGLGLPMIVVAWLIGSFAPGNTQIQVITQRVGAITFASPYDNRKQIYAEATREIKTKPWLGYGPGDFPVSSLRAGSEASSVYALHAHNLWLTWGAETGIPAVLIIVGMTAALGLASRTATRAAVRRGDRRDRAIVAGVTAALITVVGQGVVDYTLRNVVIFMTVWALVGVMLALRREAIGAAGEEAAPVEADDAPAAPREVVAAIAPASGNGAVALVPAEYDQAVADRHFERRERRLAEQSDALRARRDRIARMREVLTQRSRALDEQARALELRAEALAHERDDRAAATRLKRELEQRLAELQTREDEVRAHEDRLERELARLEARRREFLELTRREEALAARERTVESRERLLERRAAEVELLASELALRERTVVQREAELRVRGAGRDVRTHETASFEEMTARAAALRERLFAVDAPLAPAVRRGAINPLNLNALEGLVAKRGAAHPERLDEWLFYLVYLREHANAGGRLPTRFAGLVEAVFGDLFNPS